MRIAKHMRMPSIGTRRIEAPCKAVGSRRGVNAVLMEWLVQSPRLETRTARLGHRRLHRFDMWADGAQPFGMLSSAVEEPTGLK